MAAGGAVTAMPQTLHRGCRFQLRCLLGQPLTVAAGGVVTGELRLVAHKRQSYDVHLTLCAPPLLPDDPPQTVLPDGYGMSCENVRKGRLLVHAPEAAVLRRAPHALRAAAATRRLAPDGTGLLATADSAVQNPDTLWQQQETINPSTNANDVCNNSCHVFWRGCPAELNVCIAGVI